MSDQSKPSEPTSSPEEPVDDLAAKVMNADAAEQVKGGGIFIATGSVSGDTTSQPKEKWIER